MFYLMLSFGDQAISSRFVTWLGAMFVKLHFRAKKPTRGGKYLNPQVRSEVVWS